MRESFKTALLYGIVTLISGFIGVYGGREAASVELRVLKEAVVANTEAIGRNTTDLHLLTLQVRELSVISTKNFDNVKALEDRIKIVEQWRVDISQLAAERGKEIPELRRRVEVLERHR